MSENDQFSALPLREQRGSRARCLSLTEDPAAVSLQSLVEPYATIDPARHMWMPKGLSQPQEAKLGETPGFLSFGQREVVTEWWLAVRGGANTPNWDIACTATIGGREGLILVEAKAHANELKTNGKPDRGNEDNHARIAAAIGEANRGLNSILPGWALSRDSHYQLCNRFAWSWKIASLGFPVILLYLGFEHAEEMHDQGPPIADAGAWVGLVKDYGRGIVPEAAWENELLVTGTPLRPLIRSLRLDLQYDKRP